jgi:hypothetical protein
MAAPAETPLQNRIARSVAGKVELSRLCQRDAGPLWFLGLDLQERLGQLGLGVVLGPLGLVPTDLLAVEAPGFVSGWRPHFNDPLHPCFRQGLRELGYLEGQNVIIEQRSTQERSARFPELINLVIRLNGAVLVVSGIAAALAAQRATSTMPIVFLGAPTLWAKASWRASRARGPT